MTAEYLYFYFFTVLFSFCVAVLGEIGQPGPRSDPLFYRSYGDGADVTVAPRRGTHCQPSTCDSGSWSAAVAASRPPEPKRLPLCLPGRPRGAVRHHQMSSPGRRTQNSVFIDFKE